MDDMALPGSGIEVLSALPSRVRIRVPGLYRNPELERTLRHGLNGSTSGRRVLANVVSATVLVHAPDGVQADSLMDEVRSLLDEFASEAGITVSDLELRARQKPVHLLVTQKPKRLGALALAARLRKPVPPTETGPDEEQATALWHMLEVGQVAEQLGLHSAEGLADSEALGRLARYGRNALPEVPKRSSLAMFLDQFKELPVLLLAGSTVLSMATGGVADGLVILGVILINGVIGFVTEQTAERTIASLTHDDIPEVDVIRAGRLLRVSMTDIVPGDVFQLGQGTIVPADARLLRAEELTVDESALTGESVPVTKTMGALIDPELPLADRTNMVYRGTLVTGGHGIALVVATGRATQVGQLQAMVGEVKSPETPMQKQLRDLGERTMVIAAGVCAGVFGIGLLRGQQMGAMLRTAVSLAVAAVPEGLPTVAITTLALGIRKMKSHHILVRRLDAIETLGSVQVLCFDKTGTITENRMRVVRASVGDELLSVEHGKIQSAERELRHEERRDLERLLWVGALCSEATLVRGEHGAPSVRGSATEAALVHVALQAGVDVHVLRDSHPTRKLEPRTEARKMMGTIHARSGRPDFFIAVKGSPLEVLERCQSCLIHSQVVPLTDDMRRAIRRQNERMAGEALRVLGMAYAEHAEQPQASDDNLTWVGMMGLADPPRPGLPALFEKFRRAGVRSVMITGDQSTTAYAIAKQIGLAEDGELRTLDSIELENMDPDLLADIAPRIHVFSRVSPRHKLRIVQALQKSGLVVAMTGDGINDCPALKAADIGVAMGGNGAGGVARDVGDMILESDNLHGMLTAIEHGRVIHADIKKAVRFILSTNTSEILLTLLSVAAGFGEGMTPLQLLWINLVSDIFPELALAVQAPENDVLDQPPRDPEAKMFSKTELRHLGLEGALLTAGAMSVYTYGIRRYGLSPQASTVSFVSLATGQLLHAFSVRSEKISIFDRTPVPANRYIPMSVGGGIALTLLMQLVPGARRVFGSAPLAPVDWAVAGLGAVGPLLANEMVKVWRHAPGRSLPAPSHGPAPQLPAGAEGERDCHSMQSDFVFSSEAVTRGHPDKMCDQISDRIVAGYLRHDPDAQVAAEAALSTGIVFSSVRFASRVPVDTASLVREAIADAGYAEGRFNARTCTVMSSHIEHERTRVAPSSLIGATSDAIDRLVPAEQVSAFGFACNHTAQLMPLPIWLANKLARRLDAARQSGDVPYLTPDGKAQVAIEFRRSRPHRVHSIALFSGQRHESERPAGQLEADLRQHVLAVAFEGEEIRPDLETRVFVTGMGKGGPYVHAGLTGRKGGADTYGEYARRTDSALSGKDPARVERIGSYAARYAAKQVVASQLAEQCEVQLSYVPGMPGPASVQVETFGTSSSSEDEIARKLRRAFDFRIGALVSRFRLHERDPEALFPKLAVYGHVGRPDLDLPWERLDGVDALR